MRPDQERVTALLTQTISLLCRNGLQFKKELKIQGVLGITLDSEDVFIIHINNAYCGINDIDGICIDDAEILNATRTAESETDISSKLLKSDEILRFSDSDSRRQKKSQVSGSMEPNEDPHSSQGMIKAEADDDDDLIFVKSEIADECKNEIPKVEYEAAQTPSTSKRKRKRLASDRQEQESLKESDFGKFDEMDFRPTDGQMYGFENTADEQNFSEHVWNDDKKLGIVDESNYFNDSNLNYSSDARWQSNIYNPQAVVKQGNEQPIVSETVGSGTSTAANAGETVQLDEEPSEGHENDLADDRMCVEVKFAGDRRIRKKKFSLMLRDLMYSAFTPDELGVCTLSGRNNRKQLDPVRLEGVKKKLKERFPSIEDTVFRRLIANCLRDAKKRKN